MKKNITTAIIAILAGVSGSFMYNELHPKPENLISNTEYIPARQSVNLEKLNHLNEEFSNASETSTKSVVYIKTTVGSQYNRNNWFDYYFHGRGGQSISSGSGVIFSNDGYIVTNNHVIDNADKIEVLHEKQTYIANIVGVDPSTDLAVLKIDAINLPAIKTGNSSALRIGEWVLAVGNPFNLNTTVTAGIVSAKARSINIVNSQFPIESFIQTDAAINPGNSGGALVNLKGELVGINTAILSKTGSYAGYGFAVPVDIVSKIVNDIIHFGEVQKAFLGASVTEINSAVAERFNLKNLNGVILNSITQGGSANLAGLLPGDVILKINNQPINNKSQYDEALSYQSPGDKINIIFIREREVKETTAVLTNREGTTEFLKREIYSSTALGADFEKLSKVEKGKLGLKNGVKILSVKGGLFRRLGIEEGFIITAINQYKINEPEEIPEILEKTRGRVIIEGINAGGSEMYYTYYY